MSLENKSVPAHLFSFLPQVCLEKGVMTGGWDHDKPVVPAFDPEKIEPEKIKEAFKFGPERVLVEIVGEAKKYFRERLTGPDRKPHGIYCSYEPIPKPYLQKINYEMN